VQNVIFVVPFEVGTKEGSLYLVFQLLGLDPALGVYTAIVSRLRISPGSGRTGPRLVLGTARARARRGAVTIVTHFLATTLGVQALGLEGRDKVLAYAFGMGVDIDHALNCRFT